MAAVNQYAIDGKLGVNVLRIDPTAFDPNNPDYSGVPQFPLGTTVKTALGDEFVYCQLPQIANAGQVCLIDRSTYIAVLATSAASKIGMSAGVIQASVLKPSGNVADAGDFGWLQTSGQFAAIQVAAATAAFTTLNTSAVAGQLASGNAVGSFDITGLVLNVLQGGVAGASPGQAGPTIWEGNSH